MRNLLRFARRGAVLPLAAVTFAACGEDDPMTPDMIEDIVGVASAEGSVSTLVGAIQSAGLVSALQAEGPFTVFAPVNSAFAALDPGVLANLTGDVDLLAEVLQFHVVSGVAAASSGLTDGQVVTTLEGGELTIGVSGGSVTVNGAAVLTPDIEASNGIIHLIDAVLIPELDIVDTAILTDVTSTLVAAVVQGQLVETLKGTGPFTVFAPNNAAFAALDDYTLEQLLEDDNRALLQEILTYHVIEDDIRAAELTDGAMVETVEGRELTFDLSGATPMVNGVDIIATDIVAENGVIHLIDGVLLPELDIVETAVVTEATGTLATAVVEGDLVETLKGEGPYTVFAPNNAAFAALGDYALEQLLADDNIDLLQEILTFHVLEGEVREAELASGTVETLDGRELTIDLSGATPTVNGVDIIATDIVTENGVIHLIDGVLLPELDIVEKAIITAETGTLVAAVIQGELVETLEGEGPYTVFAPINEAFAALGTDQLDVLLADENRALLQKILTYHVIEGDIRAAELTDGASVETLQGSNVTFDLSGAMPMVNGANIIATDIVVGNGVIHLIDGVLTENADLVDVATLNGFETLVSLVAEAQLVETLRSDNGGDGWTVFAPTEAAFAGLSTVPTGDDLAAVLTYHVVSGTVPSTDLSDGDVVTTVQTGTFTVNISGDDVSITDANDNTVNVILVDVPAANGVIHVIDGVILP